MKIQTFSNVTIKQAQITDITQLQAISTLTFVESFEKENSPENMATYLAEHFSTNQLALELSNPNSSFYFAEENEQIVGYLKINVETAQTEKKFQNALEIERIYVKKAVQGKQIGQQLLEKAINIARNKKYAFIWLGVWENNKQAITFYEKNGFEVFDQHLFVLGEDQQRDLLMKRPLTQ